MMLRFCLAGYMVLAVMMPAMAFQCPTDIAKIDAALAANQSLDPNIRNVIQTLRDTGERLHKAGKHQDSVRTLAGAKQMLTKLGVKVD